MSFLDKLRGIQPEPEPPKYRFPDDKLEELAARWDDKNCRLSRLRLWRYIASCFPELDLTKGSWEVEWDSALAAVLILKKED